MKRARIERRIIVGTVLSATMLFRLFISRALLIDLPAACQLLLHALVFTSELYSCAHGRRINQDHA